MKATPRVRKIALLGKFVYSELRLFYIACIQKTANTKFNLLVTNTYKKCNLKIGKVHIVYNI
ncbi:hypothetical protein PAUR_a0180 [Pseudoalteromonas aurantia 208]|uniref:Uncharacterized protein n=1 Tax=Pseudoalteromonas aurantia 208 TaxID=1314867 RepID=A0ABR9E852_9GAMM|nr:hypothetical protein [Pseudoalteromonas aurantia 208]